MTEKYHYSMQLPSIQKYQEAFETIIDLFSVNLSNFTERDKVWRPHPTKDFLKNALQGFKFKEVEEEKLNKPALTEWIENTKNTLKQNFANIISQIEKDQELIKTGSDLKIVENSMDTAIREAAILADLTSRGKINIPQYQQSLEKILTELHKVKGGLFDTEHSMIDPKTATDSQDHTPSDITTEGYVSITEDQVEEPDLQNPNNSKTIPILGESTNGVFLIDGV